MRLCDVQRNVNSGDDQSFLKKGGVHNILSRGLDLPQLTQNLATYPNPEPCVEIDFIPHDYSTLGNI